VQGRGFIIYISISAAWAHVELTMLLKNVKLHLAGVVPRIGKIFLAYL